jgi:hypothetical protein
MPATLNGTLPDELNSANMDDLFGSAHELEQSHIQEGARDGKR